MRIEALVAEAAVERRGDEMLDWSPTSNVGLKRSAPRASSGWAGRTGVAGRRLWFAGLRAEELHQSDSRILPTRDGFVKGYNGQIAVDVPADQVIVARRLETTAAGYLLAMVLDLPVGAWISTVPRPAVEKSTLSAPPGMLLKGVAVGRLPPGGGDWRLWAMVMPGSMRQKSHGANRSRIPSLIQPSDLIHCTQDGRAARLCDRPDGWTLGADRAAYSWGRIGRTRGKKLSYGLRPRSVLSLRAWLSDYPSDASRPASSR
jgi:hypothetical protein